MNIVIEFPNDEAWVTGSHLLRRYQDSLFKCLSEQLEPKYGQEWFEKTLVPPVNPNDTVDKDLTCFLSQLLRYENQNFRLAVAQGFFKQTFLTKEQEAALKSIRRLRNKWFHESSEVKSKIGILDLEKLAQSIKVFAVDIDLKIDCERVLSGAKKRDLTEALFSLPWIARHLEQQSINTNSYKMIQDQLAIFKSDYAALTNSTEDFERLTRFSTMLEHAYQALDFQYLFLMHYYHRFQKDVLDMLEEDLNGELDAERGLLLEEIKKYQFTSPINFLTWEEHELDTIDSAFNRLRETQGGDKCDCLYCAQIPAVMSPFTVEDNERTDFFEKILGRKNGARMVRLLFSKNNGRSATS